MTRRPVQRSAPAAQRPRPAARQAGGSTEALSDLSAVETLPREATAAALRPRQGYAFVWLVGLMLVGLALAWHNRFVQDDAFISFLYARQLVEGAGLTWFGTRVEGYTNFLWVLWTALGLRIGVDAIAWSYVGGLASFALAIYALWRCARRLFDHLVPCVLAVLLFVTNYTVSAYATGGLETMLQTALLCVAVWQLCEQQCEDTRQPAQLAALSLALGAAVLTRLDSLLPAALIFLWLLGQLVRRRAGWAVYAYAAVPFAALTGPWVVWKTLYYGRLLPNSYYAKVGLNSAAHANGILYLDRFANWYLIWPILFAGIFAIAVRILLGQPIARVPRVLPLLWIIIAAWCAYIVDVGGDFMEFRFIVPIAPWVCLTLAYLADESVSTQAPALRVATATVVFAVLAAASYRHATTFTGMTPDRTLDSIPTLATFYGQYPKGDWAKTGNALRHQVQAADVSIALHPVGAIPYYSGLATVDMFGMNDLRIPTEGNHAPPDYRRPGHQLQASLKYLKERGVNLVIGDPHYIKTGAISRPGNEALAQRLIRSKLSFSHESIGDATLVAMPVDSDWSLSIWYLTPHPAIDRLISSGQWESKHVHVP